MDKACCLARDCNYLLGLKVQPATGDQVSVGVAAVDTSLKMVQVSSPHHRLSRLKNHP